MLDGERFIPSPFSSLRKLPPLKQNLPPKIVSTVSHQRPIKNSTMGASLVLRSSRRGRDPLSQKHYLCGLFRTSVSAQSPPTVASDADKRRNVYKLVGSSHPAPSYLMMK